MVDVKNNRPVAKISTQRAQNATARLLTVDANKIHLELVPANKGWVTTDWNLSVKVDGKVKGTIAFADDDGTRGMTEDSAKSLLAPQLKIIEDAKKGGQKVTLNLGLLEHFDNPNLKNYQKFHGEFGLIDRARAAPLAAVLHEEYLDTRGRVTAPAQDVSVRLVNFMKDKGVAVYVKGQLRGHVDLGEVDEVRARAYKLNQLETFLEQAQAEGKDVTFNFDINDKSDGKGTGLVGHKIEEFMQFDGMALPPGVVAIVAVDNQRGLDAERRAALKTTGGLAGAGLGCGVGAAAGGAVSGGMLAAPGCVWGAVAGGTAGFSLPGN
jgi:hypothetical protein